MNNRELNTIAQLRFTDKETQIALAKHPYLRCRSYLASNSNLCTEARDILSAGRATSVKMNLLTSGHLNDDPDKITTLYAAAKKSNYLTVWSSWRLGSFIKNPYYRWRGQGDSHAPATPAVVLEDIWETLVAQSDRTEGYYTRSNNRMMSELIEHPNCPDKYAVIASTSEDELLRKAGFDRLVAIEHAKDND
jgi:hypothetical protein